MGLHVSLLPCVPLLGYWFVLHAAALQPSATSSETEGTSFCRNAFFIFIHFVKKKKERKESFLKISETQHFLKRAFYETDLYLVTDLGCYIIKYFEYLWPLWTSKRMRSRKKNKKTFNKVIACIVIKTHHWSFFFARIERTGQPFHVLISDLENTINYSFFRYMKLKLPTKE